MLHRVKPRRVPPITQGMRRTVLLLLSLITVACAVAPATAAAAAAPPPDTEAPLFPAQGYHTVPPGFSIDPARALAIAKTAPKMRAIHRTHHPLRINVFVWAGNHYEFNLATSGLSPGTWELVLLLGDGPPRTTRFAIR